MGLGTLEDLLEDQLKDIYSAEHQLLKALPRMAKGASAEALVEAIQSHLTETEGQIERLDQIAERLGISLKGKKCKGMEGLIEEGKEVLQEDGNEAVIDAGIIAAAQKVEHYEISAYGTARALAEQLGQNEIASLLEASRDEESAADEKLTEICESTIMPEASAGDDEESDSEEEEDQPRRGQRGGVPRSQGGRGDRANPTGRSSTSRGYSTSRSRS